ncbi:MAG: ROK family protein [Gaiellaceae bacterium]
MLVAGLDVGGTKVGACLADPDTGDVLEHERISTRTELGGAVVLADCVDLVGRVCSGASLDGVGIGICELVDLSGQVTSATTIDWRGLDLATAFSALGPVTVESDVRAAALAEGRFGAARDETAPWIYLTVGTGIAYALVVDGRPFRGARGNAIVVGAPPVEHSASGLALQVRAGRASAEDVLADTALDPLVADAAAALGQALAALVNALDPARVVVGGGLGLVSTYRDAAIATMRPLIDSDGTRDVPVVAAMLGTLAGPLGAALAASRP